MKNKFIIYTILLFNLFQLTKAQAIPIVNGNMNGTAGNSQMPTGWTASIGYTPTNTANSSPTPDVLSTSFTAFNNNAAVSVAASPNGGTWVGISSSTNENEAIKQTITGLNIGQQYSFTMYVANFGGGPLTSPGKVSAWINGVKVGESPTLLLIGSTWTTMNVSFTATTTSAEFLIDAEHLSGTGGYYSIDGISNLGNMTTPTIGSNKIANSCPSTTGNITTLVTSTAPSGTTLTFHTGSPATTANKIANPTTASTGIYYAAYWDATNNYYSPVSEPIYVAKCLTNTCPSTTVDLTTHSTGTPPSGTTLQWHISNTPSSGTLVSTPNAVSNGTYYATYYDATNNCYGSVSTPIVVTINSCELDSDGDGVPDRLDLDDDNDGILDINEECNGFIAQNDTGVWTWNGDTTSTLTANFTGVSVQAIAQNLSDSQINYYINQNGGQQRIAKFGNVNFSLSFSTPVKASEIAFYIEDVDPSIGAGSPTAQYTFLVNGVASTSFSSMNVGGSSPYLVYNGATGLITLSNANNDQRILLKGMGNQLISTITLTSTGIGTGDFVAYSLFAKKSCDTDGDGTPNSLDLDSDNDGCLDALEGGANITSTQLVNSGGTVTVGTGSTAANQNLCATSTCVDSNGVPTIVGASGQTVGDAQNAAIQSGCFCYKPAVTSGTALDTKLGITALGRAGTNNGNWPMVRKGAWIALEAKTKGFVVNRLTAAQIAAIPTANCVEGMMVYDTTNNCLKIYTTTDNGGTYSWQCFNTQTCP